MCKDQITFKLNCVFIEYIVHNHIILTILTLVEKVILNAQISERPPSFKLFTAANERNAEAEKDKTRLALFFHRVQIENTLKSIKAVKELELTDLNVSKSLLSSNCTYIMLLPQECSHSRPVMWTQAVRPFCWKCCCQEWVW